MSNRRTRFALTLVVAAGSVLIEGAGAVTALAAPAPITAQGGACASGGPLGWDHGNQTVAVGETVTWRNCTNVSGTGGNHYLQSTSNGWCLANGSVPNGWSWERWEYQCRFASAGVFTYQCSVNGSSMAGTITVQGAPAATSPTQRPPAPSPLRSKPPAPSPARPGAPPSSNPTASTTTSTPSDTLALAPTASSSPSERPEPTPTPATGGSEGGSRGIPLGLIIGLVLVAGAGGGLLCYLTKVRRRSSR